MKIRVVVDGMGNFVGASPVEAAKSEDIATSGGIWAVNPGHSTFEMEAPENIFQGDAQIIRQNITKLFHSKMNSNQLTRVYSIR